MTTEDFKRTVREWGFNHNDETLTGELLVYSRGQSLIVKVATEKLYMFDTLYIAFNKLPILKQEQFFELLVFYTSTPIEKRLEEKKYYWQLAANNYGKQHRDYLNVKNKESTWILSSMPSSERFRTKFTIKEYFAMVDDNFIPDIFEKVEIKC